MARRLRRITSSSASVASAKPAVVSHGYIPPAEIDPLRRGGARGDILCRFYDQGGAGLALPLHERVIGVDLDQLRESNKVIGAAGGATKTGPISALRGKILAFWSRTS